jgi:7,8-dihydro-6-hydroxymethylpterin-pyrophosphokinase
MHCAPLEPRFAAVEGERALALHFIAEHGHRRETAARNKPELTLPHPRLFERAFVLVPLAEIAPDRVIAGRTVRQALAQLSTEGIQRLPDLD